MNPEGLKPEEVVLDKTLTWTDKMPKMDEATIKNSTLIFLTRNHLGQPLTLSIPINLDGEPVWGEDPRFVVYGIWPGVAKLAPSVKHELLHAFITIIGVPNG